jgi:hypothetical protein
MTLPQRLGRRTFLLGAAGLAASLVWRSAGSWPFLGASPSRSERLATFLKHEESARSLGREYLRAVPAEASPELLTVRVAEGLPGGLGTIDTVSDGRLRELLLAATAGDFRDLRTVELRGWVLARTEARLCALAALEAVSVPA